MDVRKQLGAKPGSRRQELGRVSWNGTCRIYGEMAQVSQFFRVLPRLHQPDLQFGALQGRSWKERPGICGNLEEGPLRYERRELCCERDENLPTVKMRMRAFLFAALVLLSGCLHTNKSHSVEVSAEPPVTPQLINTVTNALQNSSIFRRLKG